MSGFGSAGGGHSETQSVSLNLTALMDILSNLLFFLLASYTTQSIEVQSKPGLKLPASSAQTKVAKDLTISVSETAVFVGDIQVAKVVGDAIPANQLDGEKILGLYTRLKGVAQSNAAVGKDDEVHGGDLVFVLADKNTDARIIAKVLKTAAMAGFVKARFGVIAE